MPIQVDDALSHAMSRTELPRVRTELRLLPHEPINQSLLVSRGPALLCNQVPSTPGIDFEAPFAEVTQSNPRSIDAALAHS